ncbi:MAG: outer membrane beta-barrel protein [Gallionellaceae bacterium]
MKFGVRKFKSKLLLKSLFVCASFASIGAANAALSEDSAAPMIHLGGVSAYPGLSVLEKSNNNLYRSDLNKQSSLITVVSPSLNLRAEKGDDIYSMDYRADVARYAQSSADDYIDHTLSGAVQMPISAHSFVKFDPEFHLGHDDRGSTFGPGTDSPNTWKKAVYKGALSYGSADSIGRFLMDVSYSDVVYQNNRTTTTGYDKTQKYLSGSFYLRVLPKSTVFVQVDNLKIAYKDTASTLNGNELRLLLGLTWKATAQTNGTFKIGQLQKSFDRGHSTFSGDSWEGTVRWSPRQTTHIEWLAGRKSSESTGVGDLVLSTNNALDFSYNLSEKIRLHLNVAQVTEEFSPSSRSDITPSYGLKAEYRLRSWLLGRAEYVHSAKTSRNYTGANPAFTNDIFLVSISTEI